MRLLAGLWMWSNSCTTVRKESRFGTLRDIRSLAASTAKFMKGTIDMKIAYKVSGGITGRELQCELDSSQLHVEDQQSFAEAIRETGQLKSQTLLSNVARDVPIHELQITDGVQSHHIIVDDETMPAGLRPLIRFLKKRVGA